MYIYIYVYVHVNINIYMHILKYIYVLYIYKSFVACSGNCQRHRKSQDECVISFNMLHILVCYIHDIYVYIYIYVYICMCICIYICRSLHLYMYVHIFASLPVVATAGATDKGEMNVVCGCTPPPDRFDSCSMRATTWIARIPV